MSLIEKIQEIEKSVQNQIKEAENEAGRIRAEAQKAAQEIISETETKIQTSREEQLKKERIVLLEKQTEIETETEKQLDDLTSLADKNSDRAIDLVVQSILN